MKNKNDIILKYYVLPLFGISVDTLKEDYVNAYLHKEGETLFLELKSNNCNIESYPTYMGVVPLNNRKFCIMNLLPQFKNDIKLIIEGKYSQTSEQAKNVIIQRSGLIYDPYVTKAISMPLAALIKHKQLKKKLENELDVIIADESELIDKLSKEAFIEHIVESVE